MYDKDKRRKRRHNILTANTKGGYHERIHENY